LTDTKNLNDEDDEKFNVEECTVEMIIPETTEENIFDWVLRKLNCILFWDVSDRHVKNTIGSEARQILIDSKKEETRRKIVEDSLTNAVFSTNNEDKNKKIIIKNIMDTIEKLKQ
jgi:hypothetical protein